MKKANLRDDIYRNSGAHHRPFCTLHILTTKDDWRSDYYGLDSDLNEEVIKLADSAGIYAKAWKIPINKVEDLFLEKLTEIEELNEPRKASCFAILHNWDAKKALKCGLVPFSDGGKWCVGCPNREIERLDAYQVLTDKTIDRESTFFTDKERFTSIVGEEIVAAMEKILYEQGN
jgi:hypothetical protein